DALTGSIKFSWMEEISSIDKNINMADKPNQPIKTSPLYLCILAMVAKRKALNIKARDEYRVGIFISVSKLNSGIKPYI
ncbi:MAG: hypothetical protein RPR91_05830, partial [Colwellia sp.]